MTQEESGRENTLNHLVQVEVAKVMALTTVSSSIP
jgi:hypothetical protein